MPWCASENSKRGNSKAILPRAHQHGGPSFSISVVGAELARPVALGQEVVEEAARRQENACQICACDIACPRRAAPRSRTDWRHRWSSGQKVRLNVCLTG